MRSRWESMQYRDLLSIFQFSMRHNDGALDSVRRPFCMACMYAAVTTDEAGAVETSGLLEDC